MTIVSSVAVKHEHRDGWHTFTSPQLPGLCVASTDLQKAYKDVALSIETLILLNCGQAVRAVAEQTFEKFFEARDRTRTIRTLVSANKTTPEMEVLKCQRINYRTTI